MRSASANGMPSAFEGGAAVPGSRLPAAAPAALDELVGWSVASSPLVERKAGVASVAWGAAPVEVGASVDSGASLDVGLSVVVGSSVEVGAAEPEGVAFAVGSAVASGAACGVGAAVGVVFGVALGVAAELGFGVALGVAFGVGGGGSVGLPTEASTNAAASVVFSVSANEQLEGLPVHGPLDQASNVESPSG